MRKAWPRPSTTFVPTVVPSSTPPSKELESSEEARKARNYLDKRRENMHYGWHRKNSYYISSRHIESAARIHVARRCKQTRMHWRLHNAECDCTIIARLSSAS